MTILETEIGQRLWFVTSALKAWWEDVMSFTPASLRTLFQPQEPDWILELDADHLSVLEMREGQLESSAELHDWRDQEESLPSFLKVTGILAPKKAARGIIVLQNEMVMKRSFSLPLQAEIKLDRLLAAQLDTLTPFGPDEALVGWVIGRRYLSTRKLQVDLYVAPKKALQGLIDLFAHGTGDVPEFRYDLNSSRGSSSGGSGGGSGNKVVLASLAGKRPVSRPSLSLLASIALALFALGQVLPIMSLGAQVAALEEQVLANQSDVQDSLAVKQRVEGLRHNLAALSERGNGSGSSLTLLRELTQVVPDGAWFDRVLQQDTKVEINGVADDAYVLLGLLQGLEEVRDAKFLAPVVADEKLGKHRFRLVLTLEGS